MLKSITLPREIDVYLQSNTVGLFRDTTSMLSCQSRNNLIGQMSLDRVLTVARRTHFKLASWAVTYHIASAQAVILDSLPMSVDMPVNRNRLSLGKDKHGATN